MSLEGLDPYDFHHGPILAERIDRAKWLGLTRQTDRPVRALAAGGRLSLGWIDQQGDERAPRA